MYNKANFAPHWMEDSASASKFLYWENNSKGHILLIEGSWVMSPTKTFSSVNFTELTGPYQKAYIEAF